jgi:O-antigen/teichoic acid export membrane protein
LNYSIEKSHLSLKSRVLRAGSWTFAGYGSTLVLRLLGNLVISRLLAPEVFGIMGVCTAVQVIVGLTGDIGLRQAVIRSENGHDPVFLNTAWTVQILRGILIWIICVGAAIALYILNASGLLPQGSVYQDASLPFLIAATSFSTVILSLQSMKVISAGRRLDLRQITIIDLIQMISGLSVAMSMAWATRSVWSFVASGIVGSVVSVSIGHFWLQGKRDRIAWDRKALQELFSFGKWTSLSSFAGVLAMNGDRLMLGGWLTATSLGHYSIASNLSSVVDSIGSRVFGSVSIPALSEIVRNQPDRLGEVFFRMRRGADAAYVGSAGLLFAAGHEIIALLYDARYLAAGHMLQLLSFNLLFARYGLAQDVYIALGKPNYLTAINTVKLVSLFAIVPLMFHLFGSDGAILGIAVYLLPTVPLIFWLNQKHGLNNFRFEILMLGMWPIGWLAGRVTVAGLQSVRGFM